MNEYRYEEISVGLREEFSFHMTEEKMKSFQLLSGDENPMHCDEAYARSRGFKDRIVYGMLSAALFSTMAGMYLPGKYSLLENVEAAFVKPVYAGETLKVCGEVVEKNDKYRLIIVKMFILNADGHKVCRGKMNVGVLA